MSDQQRIKVADAGPYIVRGGVPVTTKRRSCPNTANR